MIPGLSIFMGSYIGSYLASLYWGYWGDEVTANRPLHNPLLIPVVGPFLAMVPGDSADQLVAFTAIGAGQLIGLGMAIGGGVWWHRDRKRAALLTFSPTGLRSFF